MRDPVSVLVQRVASRGEPLPLPSYATPGAAGLDLRSDVALTLEPGRRALVPTGIALAIPEGFEGQVRPRSGLALKHGITCLNSPGLIDSGYRGEIQVILVNHDPVADYAVHRGDRIAQLVIAEVTRAQLALTEALPESGRGAGGFGHTGKL